MLTKRLITKQEATQLLENTRNAGLHVPPPNGSRQALLRKMVKSGDPLDTGECVSYSGSTKIVMGGHDYLHFIAGMENADDGMEVFESRGKIEHSCYFGKGTTISLIDGLRMQPAGVVKLPPEVQFDRSIQVLKLYASLKKTPMHDARDYQSSITNEDVDTYISFHMHPGLTDSRPIRAALLKHASGQPIQPALLDVVVHGGLGANSSLSDLQVAVYNQLYELSGFLSLIRKTQLKVATYALELLAVLDLKKVKKQGQIRKALISM